MKTESIDYKLYVKRGLCPHIRYGSVLCKNGFNCLFCEIADRIRISRSIECDDYPLFYWKDCLVQTKHAGGDCFYNKPLVLTEDAMDRLGIERSIYNQIVFAYGGPGVFLKNKGGQIDVYMVNDHSKKFVISRYETYGIPNPQTIEKYDELFFFGLKRYL